jgi:hypothetical protein
VPTGAELAEAALLSETTVTTGVAIKFPEVIAVELEGAWVVATIDVDVEVGCCADAVVLGLVGCETEVILAGVEAKFAPLFVLLLSLLTELAT